MSLLPQIILYTALSGVLSLIGGIILLGKANLFRKFSIHLVSFTAGALLALSFLDLLPESLELFGKTGGHVDEILIVSLVGFLVFFFIERLIIHFHSHQHEHDEAHDHPTPVLMLVGDAFHNFIDGVAIAVSFIADPSLGLVTALGVAAHELPQEIGDFSVMLHHGWSKSSALWANVLVSLTSIIGAVIAYSARGIIEPYLPHILALTAGSFIYIASADLVPEIDKKTRKDKASHITLLLLAGVLVVYLLGKLVGHG